MIGYGEHVVNQHLASLERYEQMDREAQDEAFHEGQEAARYGIPMAADPYAAIDDDMSAQWRAGWQEVTSADLARMYCPTCGGTGTVEIDACQWTDAHECECQTREVV